MPVRPEDTSKNPHEELEVLTQAYMGLKLREKKLADEIAGINKKIKAIITNDKTIPMNGRHTEYTFLASDGKTRLMVRNEVSQSTSLVGDVVERVKEKLGEEAARFIVTEETLLPTALEQMVVEELIGAQELTDWTVTKETSRLIVK